MQIKNDVPLHKHSTMRLGGKAKHLVTVRDKHELATAVEWATAKKMPVKVIGGGSNIVWKDTGFNGLVIVNNITGFDIKPEDDHFAYVNIGAGENWDAAVAQTVKAGLHGIEALSLIPGTAGGTPIQNVGAYGQEIAQTLVSVEAYDMLHHGFVTIGVEECNFGYRTSRFKTKDKGRFLITSLTLRLQRVNPKPPFYPPVAAYFRLHRLRVITPKALRQAVIEIRTQKLPDPSVVANNGSFFANPIVTKSFFGGFTKKHPDAPHWPAAKGRVKLSAAWLIEHAGYKDYHDAKTGMATWHAQPLVLVNERAKTTKDLLTFRKKVTDAVEKKFDVRLEQEPELV